MKIKILISTVLILPFLSCNINKSDDLTSIIETKSFNKQDFNKYTTKSKYNVIGHEFSPILYSNVKPLKENNNVPEKIFGVGSYWKDSKVYFQKELKGESISYLEKNDTIVVRNVYYDYSADSQLDINKPRNINELKEFLKRKNVKFDVLNFKRNVKTDIIDIEIENKFYKIILNNGLLESYLFYNKKDTINFKPYKNIIANFYF
ncbi:hypothetical protein [Kaistella carnis]|uniref:Uncharacterized protein n=1 Tax=Kaistella carnis TaxID=1241979 RepID=A0A3G8XRU0_9FLAO|nr:hypothetical protein [Kaistella carnis]AZI32944.1 hypothetical protein EIB73_07055 [Kaistella carnis]